MALNKDGQARAAKTGLCHEGRWNRRINARFNLGLVLAYAVLLAVLLAHHEPWRDELHFWMSARDSQNLTQLWENRRYDGHPPLWSWLLFGASRLSHDPRMLQFVHGCISTFSMAVLVCLGPFSRSQRVALCLGYFFLYEYAVISRNYSLGTLWLWSFCALAQQRSQRYWPLAVLLLLMGATNVHIFLLGCALMLCLAGELWLRPQLRRTARRGDIAATVAISLLALGLFLFFTRLPVHTAYPVGAYLQWNAARFCLSLSTMWLAFVPLPLGRVAFHDSNFMHGGDLRWLAFFAAILWLAAHLSLRGGLARCVHLVGTALLLTFAYTKMVGFYRHQGHHYLLWLACFWLEADPSAGPDWKVRVRRLFFPLVLAVHMMAGLFCAWVDITHPFSSARQVVRLLRAQGLDQLPVVGLSDYIVAPVSAWLERPIYYASSRRWGTFVVNNIPLQPGPPPADLLAQMRAVATKAGVSQVVLVSDQPGSLQPQPGVTVRPVGLIPPGIVESERYYVDLVEF